MKNYNSERFDFRSQGMDMIQKFLEILKFPQIVDESLPSLNVDGAHKSSEYLKSLVEVIIFLKTKGTRLNSWIKFLRSQLPEPVKLSFFVARQNFQQSKVTSLSDTTFYDCDDLNKIITRSVRALGLSRQLEEDLTIDIGACEIESDQGRIRTSVAFGNKVPIYLHSCVAENPTRFNANQIVYRSLQQVSRLKNTYRSLRFRADRNYYDIRIMGLLRKHQFKYFIEAAPEYYKDQVETVGKWNEIGSGSIKMHIGSFYRTTQGWNHRFLVVKWVFGDTSKTKMFCICTNDLTSSDEEIFRAYGGKNVITPILDEMRMELWQSHRFPNLAETTIYQVMSMIGYLIFLAFRNFLVDEGIEGLTYNTTLNDLRYGVFETSENPLYHAAA